MPTSKKQLEQGEEGKGRRALEAGGCGQQRGPEEAQEAREKDQVSRRDFPTIFIFLLRVLSLLSRDKFL
jgi:hypothetical protein